MDGFTSMTSQCSKGSTTLVSTEMWAIPRAGMLPLFRIYLFSTKVKIQDSWVLNTQQSQL